jgi:hypothetical protein
MAAAADDDHVIGRRQALGLPEHAGFRIA